MAITVARRYLGGDLSFTIRDGVLFALRFEGTVRSANGYRTFRVFLIADVRISALRGIRSAFGKAILFSLLRSTLRNDLARAFCNSRSRACVSVPICNGLRIAFVRVQSRHLCSRRFALIRRFNGVDSVQRASTRSDDRVFDQVVNFRVDDLVNGPEVANNV